MCRPPPHPRRPSCRICSLRAHAHMRDEQNRRSARPVHRRTVRLGCCRCSCNVASGSEHRFGCCSRELEPTIRVARHNGALVDGVGWTLSAPARRHRLRAEDGRRDRPTRADTDLGTDRPNDVEKREVRAVTSAGAHNCCLERAALQCTVPRARATSPRRPTTSLARRTTQPGLSASSSSQVAGVSGEGRETD